MWYCRKKTISNALIIFGLGCMAGAVLTFWRAVIVACLLVGVGLIIGGRG